MSLGYNEMDGEYGRMQESRGATGNLESLSKALVMEQRVGDEDSYLENFRADVKRPP